MDGKCIYVCLSECRQIVKVGVTCEITQRVLGLKASEGQNYKLLFCSKKVELNRALEIEKEVGAKFKNNIVKGKEWFNIKPITIIEFLINELGLEPFEIEEVETQFESWEEKCVTYKTFKDSLEYPHIKEKQSKGLYCIAYIDKDKIKYRGFCNYGDAKKFYFYNKPFIIMVDNLVSDLYGVDESVFKSLQIFTKKNIYNLTSEVLEVRKHLNRLLKLTEI